MKTTTTVRQGGETVVYSRPVHAPVQTDDNRRNRRALVKALGHRQFKKLYRKAQV